MAIFADYYHQTTQAAVDFVVTYTYCVSMSIGLQYRAYSLTGQFAPGSESSREFSLRGTFASGSEKIEFKLVVGSVMAIGEKSQHVIYIPYRHSLVCAGTWRPW